MISSCIRIKAGTGYDKAYIPDSADDLYGSQYSIELNDKLRSSKKLVEDVCAGSFEYCRDEAGLKIGGFVKLSGTDCFLVTENAMFTLAPLAQDSLAFYPVDIEGEQRYLLHPIARAADAIDTAESELTLYSTGKVMTADRLVLRRSVVQDHTFFELADGPAGLFAFGDAARLLDEQQFTGIELQAVELS